MTFSLTSDIQHSGSCTAGRSHTAAYIEARSAEAVLLSLQDDGTVGRLQHGGVVRPPDPAAAIFAVVLVVVGAQDLLASLRVSQPDVAAQHIAGPLASRPIAGHPVEVALQLHLPDMTDAGRDLIDLRGARLHLLGELPSVRHEPVPAGMKRRENCGADVFPRCQCPRRRAAARSEERRVGKECRSRWSPYH